MLQQRKQGGRIAGAEDDLEHQRQQAALLRRGGGRAARVGGGDSVARQFGGDAAGKLAVGRDQRRGGVRRMNRFAQGGGDGGGSRCSFGALSSATLSNAASETSPAFASSGR